MHELFPILAVTTVGVFVVYTAYHYIPEGWLDPFTDHER